MEIDIEIKSHDEKGHFVAYGSTFGNEDLGGDVVVKGAFKKSLEDTPAENVYMFYNHDTKEIIGEYTEIQEDEHGLKIEGKLFVDNIQRAKETYFLMKKGLIKKFSIGYSVVKKSFEGGKRMLEELKLVEVSPVTFPMNPEASLVAVKSASELSKRELEQKLRDVGYSQKQAKAFIAEGWKGIHRDDEQPTNKPEVSDWALIEQLNNIMRDQP